MRKEEEISSTITKTIYYCDKCENKISARADRTCNICQRDLCSGCVGFSYITQRSDDGYPCYPSYRICGECKQQHFLNHSIKMLNKLGENLEDIEQQYDICYEHLKNRIEIATATHLQKKE